MEKNVLRLEEKLMWSLFTKKDLEMIEYYEYFFVNVKKIVYINKYNSYGDFLVDVCNKMLDDWYDEMYQEDGEEGEERFFTLFNNGGNDIESLNNYLYNTFKGEPLRICLEHYEDSHQQFIILDSCVVVLGCN